ncbi:MAG: hypothetical protein QW733_07860 [Desulfurococcaceae archaeon]
MKNDVFFPLKEVGMINELELVRNLTGSIKTPEAKYSFIINPELPFETNAIFWISKNDQEGILITNAIITHNYKGLLKAFMEITNNNAERSLELTILAIFDNFRFINISLDIQDIKPLVLKIHRLFRGKILFTLPDGKIHSKTIDDYTVDFVFALGSIDTIITEILRIETANERAYYTTLAPKDFHKIQPEPVKIPNPENPEEEIEVTPSLAFEVVESIMKGDPDKISKYEKQGYKLMQEYLEKLLTKN